MRQGEVEVRGIRFAYLEEGEGPLVLLLHGYPDDAQTWSHLLPELAAAGFRAVAPWTRGYPPTEIPADGYFDGGTLATDARELIRALGNGEPAFVVGHDWGGATAWYLVAAYPEAVRRAAILSIPHPFLIAQIFTNPEAIRSVFHFWFFQLPHLPEAAVRANDFALIDFFWDQWSPSVDDREHVAGIKRMFEAPGAVEASLGYYRAMFDEKLRDPELEGVRSSIAQRIKVPLLSAIGSDEVVRVEHPERQRDFVDAELRFELIEGAGHFIHRERPAEVNKLILDWFVAAQK
jgi:pimeloyl-ACP methyl ester carboxylesterase